MKKGLPGFTNIVNSKAIDIGQPLMKYIEIKLKIQSIVIRSMVADIVVSQDKRDEKFPIKI